MRRIKNENSCSIEQLERAAKIAACVVALYGEVYLPIFNRLHTEVTKAKDKEAQKTLALQLALNYNDLQIGNCHP